MLDQFQFDAVEAQLTILADCARDETCGFDECPGCKVQALAFWCALADTYQAATGEAYPFTCPPRIDAEAEEKEIRRIFPDMSDDITNAQTPIEEALAAAFMKAFRMGTTIMRENPKDLAQ